MTTQYEMAVIHHVGPTVVILANRVSTWVEANILVLEAVLYVNAEDLRKGTTTTVRYFPIENVFSVETWTRPTKDEIVAIKDALIE